MFFWKSLVIFYDLLNVGKLTSGSSAFSKPSLYIWKFSIHVLLKPSLKDFEHKLTSVQNEHNCMVVWTFFGTALLRDWNGNWPFPIGANEGRLLLARMSTWLIQGRADPRQDWQRWCTGLGWLEGNFDIPDEHNSSTAWRPAWATAVPVSFSATGVHGDSVSSTHVLASHWREQQRDQMSHHSPKSQDRLWN